MDYHDDIESALAAIGGTDLPLGSGSAVALTLSLAIECLALQLSLTTRTARPSEHLEYHQALQDRLHQWRGAARAAFTDDARFVGEVIEARRQRDAADADEQQLHTLEEVNAMQRANAVLLRLLDVSLGVEHHADLMFRERGAAHVRSEAATAQYLAGASTRALASMLVANIQSAQERTARFGVEAMDVTSILKLVSRIKDAPARERLDEALNGSGWGGAGEGVESSRTPRRVPPSRIP